MCENAGSGGTKTPLAVSLVGTSGLAALGRFSILELNDVCVWFQVHTDMNICHVFTIDAMYLSRHARAIEPALQPGARRLSPIIEDAHRRFNAVPRRGEVQKPKQ